MPVYTVACKTSLAQPHRKQVADAISDIHCAVTDAPPEFVNVVFMDGHRIRDGKQLGINGNRNEELTENLRKQLQAGIAKAADLSPDGLRVALLGFPASWAMEGGEVLPEPGDESDWIERANARKES